MDESTLKQTKYMLALKRRLERQQRTPSPSISYQLSSPIRSYDRHKRLKKLISELRNPTECDLKPSGTAKETIRWLKTYKFDHLIPVFCKFKCKDMLELTVEEAIEMCGRLQGTRLFYKIHKKKPSKLIYFSIAKKNLYSDDSHWKPVIFTSLNTCNLIELLKEKFELKFEPSCCTLALKTFGRVTNIDDNYLNEIPDKSMYHLDVQEDNADSRNCRLVLIRYV